MLSCFLSFDDEYEAKYKTLCAEALCSRSERQDEGTTEGVMTDSGLWSKLELNPENFKNLRWDFSQIIWEPWYLVVIDSDFNLSYLPPIALGGKVVWSK